MHNDFIPIDNIKELNALAKESNALSLGDGFPRKSQEFFLFRGAKECYTLMSSIQVQLSKMHSEGGWEEKVQDYEKKTLNHFLSEIEPFRELHNQYQWYCPPHPRTDTFWYLSVMQHFGCPTRLCDFTSDFWTAMFFALDGATEEKASCIYRLTCKNEDENNTGGNKLPRDSTGKTWPNCDVNQMLGYIIGYEGFENPETNRSLRDSLVASKSFGWDVPYFKNARITKQRGYLVYSTDVGTPLEESLKQTGSNFQKYKISPGIFNEIREKLNAKELVRWKVYLDLETAFKHWKQS